MLENLSSPIVTRLHELSDRGKLILFACCCERLFPNYEAFCVQEYWGNSPLLRTALDLVWDTALAVKKPSLKEVQSLVSQIDKVIPHADNFASPFTALAQNTAAAIIYSLESIWDVNNDNTQHILQLPFDDLDAFLHICTFPGANDYFYTDGFEAWINSAPIVLRERQIQLEDFNALKENPSLDIAKSCRERSKSEGVQPFLRGLLKEPGRRLSWRKRLRRFRSL